MELLSVIRRWAFRDRLSIREISRRTGLSRNTIRKYLRSDVVEPAFKVPDRSSKLDAFADKLSAWLKVEGSRPRKQKRTVKQLHGDLVALGFAGSYGRVAAFARVWKTERQREQQTAGRGAFVPLVFQPGEAFQFDWSEDWAIIGGERTKLQVAHFKLCYSRAFIVRAYLLQTHEMLFDAHGQAFRVFGGVPRRGIYDNMRTAVDRIGIGKPMNSPGSSLSGKAGSNPGSPALSVVSCNVQNASTEQSEASATIHSSFQHLQSIDLALGRACGPGKIKRSLHRSNVTP